MLFGVAGDRVSAAIRLVRGGNMPKDQRIFGTTRGLGPGTSRRGLLQAGLAIGTLALNPRASLGQSGGAHDHHMPEIGVANVPAVPAMDQPLIEPEVRRSANGVLATRLRCAYAYRDIGGFLPSLPRPRGGPPPAPPLEARPRLQLPPLHQLP